MADKNKENTSNEINIKGDADKELNFKTGEDSQSAMKNGNVTIEININEKGETTIGKPSVGGSSTSTLKEKIGNVGKSSAAEKAKEVYEDIKEKEKEIDLLEVSGNVAKSVKKGSISLFSFLWKSIKLVFILFFRLFMFGLNSWKFVVIVAAIAVGGTYYLYNSNEPYYNSDGYGISRITSSQEIIQIINSISIPNDSLKITLNNDLNLPPEIYNNIISLRASWLIDENGDGIADLVDYNNDYIIDEEKDSMAYRMTDRFNVRLQVWDQTITDEVQTALLDYLYNHNFIKSLNESRLNTMNGMVNVYQDQANVLDSLQYYEYFIEKQKEEQQNLLGGLKIGDFELKASPDQKDKRLYHEEIINLKENAVKSKSTLIYNTEPIVFVGNLNNTAARANSLTFYAKKVLFMLIPIALVIFVLMRRREFESIFDVKDLLEDFKN